LEEIRVKSLLLLLALIISLLSLQLPVRGELLNSQTLFPKALFESGVSAMQLGNYQEALSDFSEVIHLNGNMAGAYSNRCLAHIELKQYPAAIADCSQAISFHPLSEAYLNRGMAHYQLSHFRIAINDFTTAITINPNCAEAYLNRGISRSELGELAGLDDLAQAKQLFALDGSDLSIIEKISALIWQFQLENSRII
jgi:tetratricopeptide (TPR) repeat protein